MGPKNFSGTKNFLGTKKFLETRNFLGTKNFLGTARIKFSTHSQNIHIQNTFLTDSKQIQNILENFCWIKIFFGPKKFLIPNIFGTKFLLYLSYDSHSIHVQNTFLTDSKQIQKNFGKYVWIKIFFDPKCFWSQIFLGPNCFYT